MGLERGGLIDGGNLLPACLSSTAEYLPTAVVSLPRCTRLVAGRRRWNSWNTTLPSRAVHGFTNGPRGRCSPPGKVPSWAYRRQQPGDLGLDRRGCGAEGAGRGGDMDQWRLVTRLRPPEPGPSTSQHSRYADGGATQKRCPSPLPPRLYTNGASQNPKTLGPFIACHWTNE